MLNVDLILYYFLLFLLVLQNLKIVGSFCDITRQILRSAIRMQLLWGEGDTLKYAFLHKSDSLYSF